MEVAALVVMEVVIANCGMPLIDAGVDITHALISLTQTAP